MAIEEIDVNELEKRLADGVRLIDVREDDEYREAHVPGAESWPLSTLSERWGDIGLVPDRAVALICRSGGRSMRAAEFLAEQGRVAMNVAGGTLAWQASGRPVVAGSSPT